MSQHIVKSVKLMLLIKLFTAAFLVGLFFCTPIEGFICTIALFIIMYVNILKISVPAGLGRFIFLGTGCLASWLAMSLLGSAIYPMKQTGAEYLALLIIGAVPLDLFSGITIKFPRKKLRSTALAVPERERTVIYDAEIVDD